jgi:hypothetical protein
MMNFDANPLSFKTKIVDLYCKIYDFFEHLIVAVLPVYAEVKGFLVVYTIGCKSLHAIEITPALVHSHTR